MVETEGVLRSQGAYPVGFFLEAALCGKAAVDDKPSEGLVITALAEVGCHSGGGSGVGDSAQVLTDADAYRVAGLAHVESKTASAKDKIHTMGSVTSKIKKNGKHLRSTNVGKSRARVGRGTDAATTALTREEAERPVAL